MTEEEVHKILDSKTNWTLFSTTTDYSSLNNHWFYGYNYGFIHLSIDNGKLNYAGELKYNSKSSKIEPSPGWRLKELKMKYVKKQKLLKIIDDIELKYKNALIIHKKNIINKDFK